MSPLGIATITVFSSLALVALALVVLTRRYTVPALAIGLAGLLPLAGASTWLVRAGPAAEVARLTTESEGLREERRNWQDEKDNLEKTLGNVRAELEKLRAPGPVSVPPPDTTEAERLRAELNRADADLKVEREASQKIKDAAEQSAKLAAARIGDLERRIAELSSRSQPPIQTLVQTPTQTPAQPPPSISPSPTRGEGVDSEHLRGLFERPVSTPFYSVQPLAQPELVAGLSGSWYVVRLRPDDAPLVFPDRRFQLPEVAAALETSARYLQSDLLAPLVRAAKRRELFVRGGADGRNIDPRRGLRTPDAPGAPELVVWSKQRDGTYVREMTQRRPTDALSNENLPALRADWLRRVLTPQIWATIAPGTIEILDEPPGPSRERTAELVLFVEW